MEDFHEMRAHRLLIYARKMAAMAARPAATKEPLKVLAAPVKGVMGELTGVGGVTLILC